MKNERQHYLKKSATGLHVLAAGDDLRAAITAKSLCERLAKRLTPSGE